MRLSESVINLPTGALTLPFLQLVGDDRSVCTGKMGKKEF